MKSNNLTQKHIECAKILLNCIAQGKYSITYGDIRDLTGLSPYKKDGVPGHIGALSILCNSLSLPLISVIVVNEGTNLCGEGFFKLCNGLGVHPEFRHSMTSMFNACMNDVKQCTRWSELADYLGLEIEGLNVNKKDDQYLRYEINVSDNIEMERTVEILNKYAGTNYTAWQKATWHPTFDGCNFRFWFPKMSRGDNIPEANDCVNNHNDDWSEITFEDLKKDKKAENEYCYNGYNIVFAKDYKGNYIFRGVFVQDLERHEPYKYVYSKISDTAILYGSPLQLDIKELRIQEIKEIESSFEKTPLIGREREAIIKIRENQGVFRKQLLARYKKCCVCGVNIKDCLIASHIKPWSESEDSEKLDIDNGLLLCPNHDKLFDSGYISFDENGKIMISSELDSSNRQFLNVHDFMKITYSDNIDIYMNYHRNNKFKK